jgi:hypothetical protein
MACNRLHRDRLEDERVEVTLVNFTYGGGNGSGRHVLLLEKVLRELGIDVRVFHWGTSLTRASRRPVRSPSSSSRLQN